MPADRPIPATSAATTGWTKREGAGAYADHDPAVLVVGGGQAGLGIAARLGALGVDTLVVDRHERIGDNWRQRYHSLTLHNEVHVNHLPLHALPADLAGLHSRRTSWRTGSRPMSRRWT